jgi:hypothetical protein
MATEWQRKTPIMTATSGITADPRIYRNPALKAAWIESGLTVFSKASPTLSMGQGCQARSSAAFEMAAGCES